MLLDTGLEVCWDGYDMNEFKVGNDVLHYYSEEEGTIERQIRHCIVDHDCDETDDECVYDTFNCYVVKFDFGRSIHFGGELELIERDDHNG